MRRLNISFYNCIHLRSYSLNFSHQQGYRVSATLVLIMSQCFGRMHMKYPCTITTPRLNTHTCRVHIPVYNYEKPANHPGIESGISDISCQCFHTAELRLQNTLLYTYTINYDSTPQYPSTTHLNSLLRSQPSHTCRVHI